MRSVYDDIMKEHQFKSKYSENAEFKHMQPTLYFV